MNTSLYHTQNLCSKRLIVTTLWINDELIFFMNDNSPPGAAELQHQLTTL